MRYLLIALLGLVTLGIIYSCQKEISVEYGSSAKGSLQSSSGDCLPKTIGGTYTAAKVLNDSNYLDVTVNVTATGPYVIYTDTVNGYAFKASGTFSTTGSSTVRLKGNGTPSIAGSDDFTVFFDSSYCDVTVPVGGSGSTGGCGTAIVQGTYTVGTALTSTNTVSFTHTYATAGTYSVSTNTVNGYSFGPTSYVATAGSNTITLTATGAPTAAGTNSFNINFGDGQTCSFTVTAAGSVVQNTDYFPTTQGSYWTYTDSLPTDTFKVAVSGTTTIGGNVYQNFNYTGYYNFSEYYRKDANGFYFQNFDTSGWGPEVIFSVAKLDVNFLKNSLNTGANWKTDFAATVFGIPGSTLRVADTCINSNASVTINGKSFTNVYQIKQQYMVNLGSGFIPGSYPLLYYYAKGVGLIKVEDQNQAAVQGIRYWQVN